MHFEYLNDLIRGESKRYLKKLNIHENAFYTHGFALRLHLNSTRIFFFKCEKFIGTRDPKKKKENRKKIVA